MSPAAPTLELSKVPARIRWAVERLALEPRDHVLEIGCGRGLAAALVCPLLPAGRLTALDRSATALAAARQANRAWIDAGRLELVETHFLDADLGRGFGKVLAVNVNAFWTEPARAVAAAQALLTPGGRLDLVYEPPSPERAAALAEDLPAALRAEGLSITAIDRRAAPTAMVAVTAVAAAWRPARLTRPAAAGP